MLELELQPWYDTTTVVDDDVVESRWVGCLGWLWTWRGSESIDDRESRSSLCSVSLSRVRVCVCVCVDRSIYLHTIDQPSNHPEHTTQLLLIDIYVYKIIVVRSIEISPDSLTHIDRSISRARSLVRSIDRWHPPPPTNDSSSLDWTSPINPTRINCSSASVVPLHSIY